mgnify:CR=1 FL=1
MAISTQVALEHLIFKWQRIAQEKPSDNMIYHAPTIRALLVDLRVIAESNPADQRAASAPHESRC